jgi:hypothetical protein
MILTANESGSNVNLNQRLAGAEFASKIVEVGGVKKGQSVKDRELKYGRSTRGVLSMQKLGLTISKQHRQNVRT